MPDAAGYSVCRLSDDFFVTLVMRMDALFVHGMGRSPFSGLPMLLRLKQAGIRTHSYGYSVSLRSFAAIQQGLHARVAEVAARGEYVLIGHSLGGVLIRAVLQNLPPAPPPRRVFLLGSPLQASQLAGRLSRNCLFQIATGDCGQLLASAQRMAAIAIPSLPLTSIVGISGPTGVLSPFGDELNDGVVSLSEVSSAQIGDQVRVPVLHTLQPASLRIAGIILERLEI